MPGLIYLNAMKKHTGLYLFFIALGGDLLGIVLHNQAMQFVFKPMIIPSLILYLSMQQGFSGNRFLRWIMIALVFSWLGDVLLMFDDRDPMFFILGLSSFLLAHVFYIIYFHQLRVNESIRVKPLIAAGVGIYYATLLYLLFPFLGAMKMPVTIYGLVISLMLMLAVHMLYLRDIAAGKMLMAGAILFVISDSVLAFNKFYQAVDFAGFIIMSTYGFAQLLLVIGAVKLSGKGEKSEE